MYILYHVANVTWYLFILASNGWICYIRFSYGVSPMPKPEIHFSPAFGMGVWIGEDGTLISCPAFENCSFDVENAIAVDEWDDFTVYTHDHMRILAQIVQICTLKRDYVNIGYYAERFSPVA